MTYKVGYDDGWQDGRKALLEEQKAAKKVIPCTHPTTARMKYANHDKCALCGVKVPLL